MGNPNQRQIAPSTKTGLDWRPDVRTSIPPILVTAPTMTPLTDCHGQPEPTEANCTRTEDDLFAPGDTKPKVSLPKVMLVNDTWVSTKRVATTARKNHLHADVLDAQKKAETRYNKLRSVEGPNRFSMVSYADAIKKKGNAEREVTYCEEQWPIPAFNRSSGTRHRKSMVTRLPAAQTDEEALREDQFVDLLCIYDVDNWYHCETRTKVNIPFLFDPEKGTPFFEKLLPEIRMDVFEHALQLPGPRDTVFVQPPRKWWRYENPDFKLGVYSVSKQMRQEAIQNLLRIHNLNFDDRGDIQWLYFWANNAGVHIDVESCIRRVQFLEFDRYGQHALNNAFLTRIVNSQWLRELRIRLFHGWLKDMEVEEIIDRAGFRSLRGLHGLEFVEVWKYLRGDDYTDPRLHQVQEWLREKMYTKMPEDRKPIEQKAHPKFTQRCRNCKGWHGVEGEEGCRCT